jgi:ABC-type antimicrobial peptide transport system permease subunit
LTGIVIAIGFGLLAFILMIFIQKSMDNIEIPKITVIIISAIIGTLTGLPTSFIAAKRAARLK